jgi:hypothetical protein
VVTEADMVPIENHAHSGRQNRVIGAAFWIIAVLVTAFAWAGLSLKDLLAALGF